jgi:DNA-binding MarR family transcriptional regulator
MLRATQDNILLDGLSTFYKTMKETETHFNITPLQLNILLVLAATSTRNIPSLTVTELCYYIGYSDANIYQVYKALDLLEDETGHTKNKPIQYNITPKGLQIVKHCINLSKQYTEDFNTLAQSIL